jgi:DNA recombination protein RmuC
MTVFPVVLLAAISFLVGAVFAWLLFRSKTAALQERKNSLEQELAASRAANERHAEELRLLGEARSALDATLASERRNTEEKLKLLQDASEQLKLQFKSLAAAALETNNANFLQLAKSVLQNQQTQAAGELAQKELAVKNLVEPIAQSLSGMNQQIQALEQTRSQAYGTLTSQVASLLDTQKALQVETGNLVKALREPQARGRWGELQLHRVLELSGMLEYCDFKEQLSFNDDERRFRPDVIVDLPGGKQIVVDAKVPLTAYSVGIGGAGRPYTQRASRRPRAAGAAAHRLAREQGILDALAVHAGVRGVVSPGRSLLSRGNGRGLRTD